MVQTPYDSDPPSPAALAEPEGPAGSTAPLNPQDDAPSEAILAGAVATMAGAEVRAPGPVLFETGKDTLRPESDQVLAAVEKILKSRLDITLLRVEVHTDSQGADRPNQILSEKRSLAVVRWFVSRGTDCKRLVPVGFGETKPTADNATAEGRAQNRRTSFFVAALRGRAIGGAPVDGGGLIAGDPCHS